MKTYYVLFLYLASILDFAECMPVKSKGADFWQNFPEFVSVQATPTQSLNLTLQEFKVLAEQNRVVHNNILPSTKTNFTLSPFNTLLFGDSNSSIPRDEDDGLFGDVSWPRFFKGMRYSYTYTYLFYLRYVICVCIKFRILWNTVNTHSNFPFFYKAFVCYLRSICIYFIKGPLSLFFRVGSYLGSGWNW